MTRRAATRALLAGALALIALLATGCGVRPSGVITGSPALRGPAIGVGLYLVRDGEITLVVRPAKTSPSPDEVIGLLAAGPDGYERSLGFTSEVPADVAPASVGPIADRAGVGVTLSGPVGTLSATAVDQIACTLASAGIGDSSTPVTLHGTDGDRQSQVCPRF
ncbi:hypothetical protein AB0J20_12900 [Micromonospora costi]|uniref:hypothetical protein n=1 Tax=Micromonospora costi TaxID=1530042 RepID=UPI0033C52505